MQIYNASTTILVTKDTSNNFSQKWSEGGKHLYQKQNETTSHLFYLEHYAI